MTELTLAEFLAREKFSRYFISHFMTPIVSAVWSCDPTTALAYPARYLFTFLGHHGLLGVIRFTAVAHRHRRLTHLRGQACRHA